MWFRLPGRGWPVPCEIEAVLFAVYNFGVSTVIDSTRSTASSPSRSSSRTIRVTPSFMRSDGSMIHPSTIHATRRRSPPPQPACRRTVRFTGIRSRHILSRRGPNPASPAAGRLCTPTSEDVNASRRSSRNFLEKITSIAPDRGGDRQHNHVDGQVSYSYSIAAA